jgi:hypothetical protein
MKTIYFKFGNNKQNIKFINRANKFIKINYIVINIFNIFWRKGPALKIDGDLSQGQTNHSLTYENELFCKEGSSNEFKV